MSFRRICGFGRAAAFVGMAFVAACGPTTVNVPPADGGVQQDRSVWTQDSGGRPPPCDPDDPNHQPQPEVCNSVDDDCNGAVDDNVPPRAKPEDPCVIQVCVLGGWQDAPPEFAEEICNGCDDDNDGCLDGNWVDGVCRPLTRQDPSFQGVGCPVAQQCQGGQWVSQGQATSSEEVCDCIDNDCDGVVDNIGVKPCMVMCNGTPNMGTKQCENCREVCKPQGIINVEVCDGKDNDCDGKVDEGVAPRPCPCGSGQEVCQNGQWVGACDQCRPGSTRWCDDPQYCHWGKQTCVVDPDGKARWGDCREVDERPPGCEGQLTYDPKCCERSGECCQDAFHTWQSCGHCEYQCAGSTFTPCS